MLRIRYEYTDPGDTVSVLNQSPQNPSPSRGCEFRRGHSPVSLRRLVHGEWRGAGFKNVRVNNFAWARIRGYQAKLYTYGARGWERWGS
jgi:hypothetical protein